MTPNRHDAPAAGSPESHWGTSTPEDQPPRELVLGLPRMIIETRDRLGPGATPEAVAEDLRARGIEVRLEDVVRCCGRAY